MADELGDVVMYPVILQINKFELFLQLSQWPSRQLCTYSGKLPFYVEM